MAVDDEAASAATFDGGECACGGKHRADQELYLGLALCFCKEECADVRVCHHKHHRGEAAAADDGRPLHLLKRGVLNTSLYTRELDSNLKKSRFSTFIGIYDP